MRASPVSGCLRSGVLRQFDWLPLPTCGANDERKARSAVECGRCGGHRDERRDLHRLSERIQERHRLAGTADRHARHDGSAIPPRTRSSSSTARISRSGTTATSGRSRTATPSSRKPTSSPRTPSATTNSTSSSRRPRRSPVAARGAATAASSSPIATRCRSSIPTTTRRTSTASAAASTSKRRRWSMPAASRANGKPTTSSSPPRASPTTARCVKPGYVTVIHNGVLVQNHFELQGGTYYDRPAAYEKHPVKQPIRLQNHGNPVKYRNIWIREIKTIEGKKPE